jgi:hypothetical protein
MPTGPGCAADPGSWSSWDAAAIADPAFISKIVPETASTPAGTWLCALEGIVAATTPRTSTASSPSPGRRCRSMRRDA